MNKLSGRPIDLSGINIQEIEVFMKNHKESLKYIKCQCIISLHKGNSMQNVCNVLGVTRETVRLWKNEFRKNGLSEVLQTKKVGKRAKINKEKLMEIKKIIKQKPSKYEYDGKKWSGKMVSDLVEKKWNIKIGVRAAQLLLKNIK